MIGNAEAATSIGCFENCTTCDGPGEYECRTCISGYCIEDEAYRTKHYDGLGKCWNLECKAKTSSGEVLRAITIAAMIVIPICSQGCRR